MADREARLKFVAEFLGLDKGADQVIALVEGFERLESAGVGTAKALDSTAAAADKVEAAERDVAQATAAVEQGLERAGLAARESASETSSAASQSAEALGRVEAAAETGSSAIREIGASAKQSGVDSEVALDKIVTAEQEVAGAAKQTATAAKSLADQLKAAANEQVSLFRESADAIRQTDIPLESQKIALQGIAKELAGLTRQYTEQGPAGRDAANLTGEALTGVKAKLADVNREIAEQIKSMRVAASEGVEGFGEIAGASLTFEAAASGALREVNRTWEQYNETQRITPRQINMVAQAIASMKLAMIDAAERGEAATIEQLAVYEKLEAQLQQLTARANQLTNASKDNAVRLKETGSQVQGLAFGVQQLTSVLGPNAAKVGMLVGNVGQLGGAIEQLKDHVGGLNVNTLGAAKSATALGIQLVSLIATVVASVAAGTKLAATNEENASLMEEWGRKIKEIVPTLDGLKTRLDAVQFATQNVIADADQFVRVNGELETSTASYDSRLRNLIISLNQSIIGLHSGRAATDAYALAIREGIDVNQAFNLSIESGAEIMQLYNETRNLGTQGHELWSRVLKESNGNAVEWQRLIREAGEEVTTLAGKQGKLTEALQKEFDARKKVESAIVDAQRLAAAERSRLDADSKLIQQQTARLLENNEVTKGTTRAINEKLAAISQYLPKSAEYAATLTAQGSQLKELADSTAGLSREERARIEALATLVARSAELTDAERIYAKALADSIAAGTLAAASLEAQHVAAQAARDAIAALTDALTAEVAGEEAKEAVIRRLADSASEALAKNNDLTASERLRLSTIVELSQQIADLTEKQAANTRAKEESVAATQRETDAELENIRTLIAAKEAQQGVAQQDIKINMDAGASLEYLRQKEQALIREKEGGLQLIKSARPLLEEEIDQRVKQIQRIQEHAAAQENLTKSTNALTVSTENGKTVLSNLVGVNEMAGDSIKRLGSTTGKSADEVVAGLQRIDGGMRSVSTATSQLTELLPAVDARIRELEKTLGDASNKVLDMAAAIDKLSDASARAAGSEETGVTQ